MNRGKRIWTEDDATPGTEGHETLGMAWRRLFGEELDTAAALAREDAGDAFYFLMPNGHVACVSYDGGSIHAPA